MIDRQGKKTGRRPFDFLDMKMYKSKEVKIYKDIFRKGQRDKIKLSLIKLLQILFLGTKTSSEAMLLPETYYETMYVETMIV